MEKGYSSLSQIYILFILLMLINKGFILHFINFKGHHININNNSIN